MGTFLTPSAPVCWTVVLTKLQELHGSVVFTVWYPIWFGPFNGYTVTEKQSEMRRTNDKLK